MVIPYGADDLQAVEAGRQALHHAGEHEAAAQLSWLASRMRVERQLEVVADMYGHRTLRAVDGYYAGRKLERAETRALMGDT